MGVLIDPLTDPATGFHIASSTRCSISNEAPGYAHLTVRTISRAVVALFADCRVRCGR
jgi:hypothetical protein